MEKEIEIEIVIHKYLILTKICMTFFFFFLIFFNFF